MADIKEIMEQGARSAKKVVKSPLFLAVCGVGIIALVWDSGNKGSSETTTFSEATGVDGYPDVSGDVSTLADNMNAAMQEMYDAMTENNLAMQEQLNDTYLQMQEQNAAAFEQLESQLDNKISNMNFVTKESVEEFEDYKVETSSGSVGTALTTMSSALQLLVEQTKTANKTTTTTGSSSSKSTSSSSSKSTSSSSSKSTSSSKSADTYTYKTKSGYNTSTSIVDAIKVSTGNYNSPDLKAIAKANGITNYTGTAKQNTQLLNSLKAGTLKKA